MSYLLNGQCRIYGSNPAAASSWCDCPTAPPAPLEKPRLFSKYKLKRKKLIVKGNTIVIGDRYSAVSYGFVNLILSNSTHIPSIHSVIS